MAEYIFGVSTGLVIGVVVMAIVNAGTRADECAECQERQNRYMASVRARKEDADG